MRNKVFIILSICMFFIACTGGSSKKESVSVSTNTANKKTTVFAEEQKNNDKKDDYLEIDSVLLKKYRNIDTKESDYLGKFKQRLLSTIASFQNRKVDTTIFKTGKIDNAIFPDTISSRVYLDGGQIYIQSKWRRNDTVMWKNQIINPYMWIDESPLFDTEERDLWIVLTIAIHYSLPEFVNKQKVSSLSNDFIFPDIKGRLRQNLLKYYSASISNLLVYGEPEARNSLYFWYEPEKKFLLYYTP